MKGIPDDSNLSAYISNCDPNIDDIRNNGFIALVSNALLYILAHRKSWFSYFYDLNNGKNNLNSMQIFFGNMTTIRNFSQKTETFNPVLASFQKYIEERHHDLPPSIDLILPHTRFLIDYLGISTQDRPFNNMLSEILKLRNSLRGLKDTKGLRDTFKTIEWPSENLFERLIECQAKFKEFCLHCVKIASQMAISLFGPPPEEGIIVYSYGSVSAPDSLSPFSDCDLFFASTSSSHLMKKYLDVVKGLFSKFHVFLGMDDGFKLDARHTFMVSNQGFNPSDIVFYYAEPVTVLGDFDSYGIHSKIKKYKMI